MPLAIAAVVGVLVNDLAGGHQRLWGGLWFALIGLGIVMMTFSRGSLRQVICVLVFLPLGALLHHRELDIHRRATITRVARDIAQSTVLEGRVEASVIIGRHPQADQRIRRGQSPWRSLLEVEVSQVRIGRRMRPVNGRVLVVVDARLEDYVPADRVRCYGALRQFLPPTNPGQRDLRPVYQQRGLHARMDVESKQQIISLPSSASAVHPRRLIASVATASRKLLLDHTSEQSGPLAVALVIGQRDFVDERTRDLLLVTGTAHLLSVSGLHLAIVVIMANWTGALLRMPTGTKIGWVLAVCILYTAITGCRPPVMRASVLVGTFLFALWMKRPSQPINTLALAALILLFINPLYVFSIGVQLSFLAVSTLVLCGQRSATGSPAVQAAVQQEENLRALVDSSRRPTVRYLRHASGWLWQTAWYSGCVTSISLPLIWYHFHVVSPISVLANVVLGPLLFLALAAGIVTILLGSIAHGLAVVPGYVCDNAIGAMNWLIELAAAVPFGHHWLPAPPVWWVFAFYGVFGATLMLGRSRATSCLHYGWIATWILVAWLLATRPAPMDPSSVEATFIDVGHGTSVVLRFADDQVWLYDCGRLGNDSGNSRGIDTALWSLGVTHLDAVLLSHADADHFNALPGVLRRFSVGRIITPPGLLQEPEPSLTSVRRAIAHSSTVVAEVSSGSSLSAGNGGVVSVLHPPKKRLPGSDNANSLVIRFDCGGKSLVLPGDLEPPGTRLLIDSPRPPPGSVLMAPHHGSLAMDATSVLRWARPAETVVSGGRRARRPEVREMLAVTGSGVWVTGTSGAIRVRIDARGEIEVRAWRDAPW